MKDGKEHKVKVEPIKPIPKIGKAGDPSFNRRFELALGKNKA